MRYGFPVVGGVIGGTVPSGFFGVTPGFAWAMPFISVGPMAFAAFPVGVAPFGYGPYGPFGV